jgi:hypothetical protein
MDEENISRCRSQPSWPIEQFSEIISDVPVILEPIVEEEEIDLEIGKTEMLLAHRTHLNKRMNSVKSLVSRERIQVGAE